MADPAQPGTPSDSAAPSPWVLRFAPLVPAGARVLDLACGGGRHALFFARRGCAVLAVDRDPAAAAVLAAGGVQFLRLDLEADRGGPVPAALAARRFDAIVVTRYLHRPLLPWLAGALEPGGLLLYETFALGQARHGRPARPEFLLRPAELLLAFGARLHVVAYEDGVVAGPPPARVQRLCAARAQADGAPPALALGSP